MYVTVHAARRWAQRVRNDSRQQLRVVVPDLRRIAAACGRWSLSPPPWWAPALGDRPAPEGWLTFGPDIAMPVRNGAALTTMVRGSLAPEVRGRRREKRKARAAARRASPRGRRLPFEADEKYSTDGYYT